MEYNEGNTDITLSAKLDPVISLIATSETGTHTIDKKTLIWYTSCPKRFTMPSAHRAHVYTHFPARHNCTQCTCKFAFVSWLKQHKYAHMKNNLHKCFHGTCKKSYCWPQDLSRHITKHLDKLWSCDECDKTFKEKRLLKRHSIKHTNVYRYKCTRCHYRTKWLTPYCRHVLKCK